MLRRRQHLGDRAALNGSAVAQHDHLVHHLRDHGEVVADEEQRHPALTDESVEERQHLGLDRHVERGRRLVGDQETRSSGEGDGDGDALSLSAGQLVRI